MRMIHSAEMATLEAVMANVDPATWPGLTVEQRAALSRFAKPAPLPNDRWFINLYADPAPMRAKSLEEAAARRPTSSEGVTVEVVISGTYENMLASARVVQRFAPPFDEAED